MYIGDNLIKKDFNFKNAEDIYKNQEMATNIGGRTSNFRAKMENRLLFDTKNKTSLSKAWNKFKKDDISKNSNMEIIGNAINNASTLSNDDLNSEISENVDKAIKTDEGISDIDSSASNMKIDNRNALNILYVVNADDKELSKIKDFKMTKDILLSDDTEDTEVLDILNAGIYNDSDIDIINSYEKTEKISNAITTNIDSNISMKDLNDLNDSNYQILTNNADVSENGNDNTKNVNISNEISKDFIFEDTNKDIKEFDLIKSVSDEIANDDEKKDDKSHLDLNTNVTKILNHKNFKISYNDIDNINMSLSDNEIRANVINQITDYISTHNLAKDEVLTIVLNPASLGKITMAVQHLKSGIAVTLLCENAKTYKIVSEQSKNMALIMEKHFGEPTVVNIQNERKDYLHQHNEKNQSSYYESDEKGQRNSKKDATDSFIERLRLGLD